MTLESTTVLKLISTLNSTKADLVIQGRKSFCVGQKSQINISYKAKSYVFFYRYHSLSELFYESSCVYYLFLLLSVAIVWKGYDLTIYLVG